MTETNIIILTGIGCICWMLSWGFNLIADILERKLAAMSDILNRR